MPDQRLPPALRGAVEQLGSADIMVGIPSYRNAATIGHVVRAAQAGLVQYFPDLRPVLVNADAGSPDGTARVVVDTEPPDYVERILLVRPRNKLQRISLTYPEVDGVGGKGAALRTIFRIADALRRGGARGRRLRPALHRARMGGAAGRAHPQGRLRLRGAALQPLQVGRHHHQHGDLSLDARRSTGCASASPSAATSASAATSCATTSRRTTGRRTCRKFGIDIWMTTTAITGGFAVCQTRLGAKVHDPKDPGADLGPMFSQVVGTLLRLTDRHAQQLAVGAVARTTCPSTASSATPIRRRSRSTSRGCSMSSVGA